MTITSDHAKGCGKAISLRVVGERGYRNQRDNKLQPSEADEAGTGLRDLSKVVIYKAFVPLIHAILTTRMSRAQRFPPAGEDEDDNEIQPTNPRHARDNAVSLPTQQSHPTQQMIDYKKKLKDAGRKPEKKKRAPPEQHFDDCGEDLSSIWHWSLIPESYYESCQEELFPRDLIGPDCLTMTQNRV